MKFSSLLILLPLASVSLALPQSTTVSQCVNDYCVPMSNDLIQCAKKFGYISSDGTPTTKSTYDQGYLECVCTGTVKSNYSKCVGCSTDQSSLGSYVNQYNNMCATYSKNSSSNKSGASSDKTCSWRMVGLAVAGGIIAAI